MSLGILVNYIDRVNISHALVPISAELHLSPVERGVLFSAFSWGYVALMGIGGLLIDRYGAIRMSATAACAWSLSTLLSGLAWNFSSILVSRFAVGIGEAPIFPANARLVREEFPLDERGRATALFDVGSYIGTALSAPIVVFLIVSFGWRTSFFACALLGLIWVALWLRLAPGLSGSNPTSAPAPRRPVLNGIGCLLRNRKVLGASCGFFAYNYAKSFFLTWFPAYLVSEKGFSFLRVGIVGMIPAMCAVLGGLSAGWWTDRLIRNGISVTVARKLPLCLGMLLAASVVLADHVTSQWAVLGVLSFAFASTIGASSGIWAIPGDIAPSSDYVGTIGGIQNTVANMAGIVAPVITGWLVAKTGSFGPALALSGAISVSGAVCYWFVVGELRPLWTVEEGT
ncbi:MAG: MFS transporter [Polyangia bacterium]